MRISEELLEEIKRNNDIVDIVSQYVSLKRKGRNYFGICPFHNEKSPSMSVSPERQIFKCFGCGEGGNVFHFIMKIENISFLEAVEMLAHRVGIEIPKTSNPANDRIAYLKDKVYKVNAMAADFYFYNLFQKTSKVAQQYVIKRKLDQNTLKAFKIGYAGNDNKLLMFLKSKGFQEEEMLESNLIGKTKEGRLYEKFRNRLMIPIADSRGRIIGFGGRVLDDSKPKYINSPTNIVYDKGRNLFGLNVVKKANIGTLKKILVVEGYMDAISLYQRGITNVVASLGTALTDAQARLLRKNAEQIVLGYDADGAGQQAIKRAAEILENMSTDIRILQIYDAKDPDEFVLKYGSERLKKAIDEAITLVEFKIKILKQEYNLENVADKAKFLTKIADILSEVESDIERELYIDKIADTYKISEAAINAEVNKRLYANKTQIEDVKTDNIKKIITNKQENKIPAEIAKREKLLIYLLLTYPNESYERLKKNIPLEYIQGEKNKEIIKKLYEELEDEETRVKKADNLIDTLEGDMANYVSGIIMSDVQLDDVEKAIEDINGNYIKDTLLERRNELLKQAGEVKEKEQIDNILKELQEVSEQIAKIGKIK